MTLVETMQVLYLGTTPLAIRHDAIGLGVEGEGERGVLSYLIQPHSHSVVIQTPPGIVSRVDRSAFESRVLKSSFVDYKLE